jgi:hypothetical protein
MTSALNELVGLVAPPAGPRPQIDWPGVESVLSFRLPADYKSVIETYGSGQFDAFLTLYQPVTPFLTIELGYQAKRQSEILAHLRASGSEHIPFVEGELLPVAGTDNGDTVYWVREDPNDPESWTITGNEARNTAWPRFPGGIADFLVAVLSRRTRFPIFPEDFPSRRPQFEPETEPDPVRVARLRAQGLYRDR